MNELKPSQPYMTADEYDLIRPAIKQFERDVWFGKGLFEHVNGTTKRGQSGMAGGLKVLVWTCAGRTMITFHDDQGDWLSLMVAEDSRTPTMGLHMRSIEPETIEQWLYRVNANWSGVKDDDGVTLDILAGQ